MVLKTLHSISLLTLAIVLLFSNSVFVNCANDSESESIRFFLYTNPSTRNGSQELFLNDTSSLNKTGFISGKPLKVLIHGFRTNESGIFPQNVKDAYLNEKNGTVVRNIITIDWSSIASPKPGLDSYNLVTLLVIYSKAATKVNSVGAQIANLLSYFIDTNQTSTELIHLIGHSIGAHVAGTTANSLKEKYGKKVKRNTGLDPAGPLFYSNVTSRPLTKKDGEFVDIVHTDQGAFGKAGQIGHVDFFPNGGTFVQYGCRANGNYSEILNPLTDLLTLGALCSHSESHRLFAKSIGTTSIKGCKTNLFLSDVYYCNPGTSEAIFGDNCSPQSENGKYYLNFAKHL